MQLKNLNLTNFRNHKNLKLKFDGDATLITGPNGSGKTNILEAIHLLATTKSLRTQFDREVISHDENFARIEAEFKPNGGKKTLEMVITKSEAYPNMSSKKVKIDKVTKSLSDFAGTINTVLFTPHDIEMLTQPPSIRRRYLDLLFFQIDREYKRTHSQYVKAVRQRNKILEKIRDFGTGKDELEYWTEKVLSMGSLLQAKRRVFFTFVQENIHKHLEGLNDKRVDFEIKYDISEINEERLEKYKDAEVSSAQTLVGPHRDDFSIEFDGFDIASFGSRGQKRTTLLALKLCEIDFINEHLSHRPILLLDDIFSELDHSHREAVMNIIHLQQTIITSAEDLDFNGKFTGKLEKIPL